MSSQNQTKNLGLCQFGDNDIPDWRTDYTGDMDKIDRSIKTISDEVAEVKKSVSDGKSKVASAITDKGVATLATDTFDVMAENIRKIPSGEMYGLCVLWEPWANPYGVTSNNYGLIPEEVS